MIAPRKYICFALIFTILHCSVEWSYSQTNPDLKQLRESTARRSIHLDRYIAKEIKNAIGEIKYHDEVKVPSTQSSEFDKAIGDAARAYEARKDELDTGLLVLKGNNTLVKGTIAAGLVLAPETGGASLIISAVGYIASEGLDKVEELAKDASRDELRRNLKTNLEKIRTSITTGEFEDLTRINDPLRFREEIERRTGPLLGNALDNIPVEDQPIVNNFYNKFLAETLRDGLNSLSNVQELQQSEIDRNRSNIVGLARTFANFARETKDRLDKMQETQTQIQSGVEQLNQKVGQTQKDIEFLQQFMFGKMTPAEQINALQQGIFPSMPESERQGLLNKIALEKKRQEFNQHVSDYLNGAGQVLNIARKFGVAGPFIEKAEQVVNIAANAFNAFTAFSSGNFLAGVGALANIFGIGGRDIAAERHEELKKMLGAVYEQVNLIDRKIDALLKGQETIIKNQQLIFQSIQQLSEQVQSNHRQVMDKLQEIHGDLLYNRALQRAEIEAEYELCRRFIVNNQGKKIIDTAKGLYPTHEQFLTLFDTTRLDTFRRCETRLQLTRTGPREFHKTTFWIESYKDLGGTSNITNIISLVYKPLLDLIIVDSSAVPISSDLRFISLLAPMARVQDIDLKIREVANPFNATQMQEFKELMGPLLYPSMVQRHTGFVLDIHYYHQITDREDRPLSFNEVKALKQVRQTGLDDLLEAQKLVDTAIAQQVLLSGDVVLPIIEDIIKKPAGSGAVEALRAKALAGLKNNSLLARNFAMYSIRKEVASKSKFLIYSIALGGKSNLSLLRDATSFPWEFSWSDVEVKQGNIVTQPMGWSVKLGDIFIALPTSDELLEGRLVYNPDLNMLLGLRSRILDEINSYRIFDRMTDGKSRRGFNTVVLNSL